MLTDQLNATIWRVIIENADWEAINDDPDPSSFNWAYYNAVYESPRFQDFWSMLEYLNAKGVVSILINVMGVVPDWIGGSTVRSSAEDEWVEMIASFVYYGRNVRGLQFTMLSPMNETDLGAPEGPKVDAAQYARLTRKLIERLAELGLGDVQIVGPDTASVRAGLSAYWPTILADSTIMSRLHHFSLHDYGGFSAGADHVIRASAYPERNYWMTEWAGRCPGCDGGQGVANEWSFARETSGYLLDHLNDGAAAMLYYDAYDTYYVHHQSNSSWGLLRQVTTSERYAPRKRFYTTAQVFKFVPPQSVRIDASISDPGIKVAAFHQPDTGRLTIVGQNLGMTPARIVGKLENLDVTGSLELFQTTVTQDLVRGPDISIMDGSFVAEIAADSVFTLTGNRAFSLATTEVVQAASSVPEKGNVLVGSRTIQTHVDSNPPGVAEAFEYSASASGSVNQLSIYLDSSSTATRVVVGLYENADSDHPTAVLTQGALNAPVIGAWNSVEVPVARVTAGTKYWIAVLTPPGAGQVVFRDTASGSRSQTSRQTDLDTLPTVWSIGERWATSEMSAYAAQSP
jgi:O-glycosyl hydrolase